MSREMPEQLLRNLDLRYRGARFERRPPAGPGCGCQKCRHAMLRAGSALTREVSGRTRQEPRNILLLHGTTLSVARRIQADQRMVPQTTYLAFGWRNRDLARVFAHRAHRRRPREGGPALVAIALAPDAYERLRRERLVRTIAFDPEDRPELRNRMQLVVEPGGVEILNRGAERFAVIPLMAP